MPLRRLAVAWALYLLLVDWSPQALADDIITAPTRYTGRGKIEPAPVPMPVPPPPPPG